MIVAALDAGEGSREAGSGAGEGAQRRYRVIHNPNAGSKGVIPTSRSGAEELRAVLADHGLGSELVEPASEDDAVGAVREAVREGIDVVVAAGGDGTARMVATELLGSETALGVLPMGSVMNIARSLGMPRDLTAAAEAVAGGRVVAIDVGEVEGDSEKPFFEAGSVGMNAAMFREAARFDDNDWLSVLRTIAVAFRYRPARMEIRIDDGVVRTRALMITVSNGPFTGAGMTVAPDARLDDGLFDVRVFRGFSKWELVRHLAAIAFGRYHYAPHVSTYRSRRVTVTSAHPLPARADDRDLGTTPVTFVIRPSALRVVVPQASGS